MDALPSDLLERVQESKALSIDTLDVSRCVLLLASVAWQSDIFAYLLLCPCFCILDSLLLAETYLCECSNKLSELLDLAMLKYLVSLQLKYNLFTRLPSTLLSLPRLETLELAGNHLTVLDERILAALPRLRLA